MQQKNIVRGGLALVVALLALLAWAPGAHSVQRGVFSLGPSKPVAESAFPALTGHNSAKSAAAFLDCTPSGAAGANQPSCDNIDLDIEAPAVFTDPKDDFLLHIRLSWTGVQNDLDMLLWSCTTPATRGGTCTRVKRASSDTANPEILTTTNLSGGRYHLVIMNQVGANTGYRVRAEYRLGDFEPFPRKKDTEEDEPVRGSAPLSRVSRDPDPAADAEADPRPKPSPVKTPGTDGPLVKTQIPPLSGGLVKGVNERRGASPLITLLVVLAILLPASVVFIRRARHQSKEEAS